MKNRLLIFALIIFFCSYLNCCEARQYEYVSKDIYSNEYYINIDSIAVKTREPHKLAFEVYVLCNLSEQGQYHIATLNYESALCNGDVRYCKYESMKYRFKITDNKLECRQELMYMLDKYYNVLGGDTQTKYYGDVKRNTIMESVYRAVMKHIS